MFKSNFIKNALLSTMVVFPVGMVSAQDTQQGSVPIEEAADTTSISIDQIVKINYIGADYFSKYVWRGFELFGDVSAFQPSVDMAFLGESGLGLNIWGSIPNGSGYDEFNEVDYTLSYAKSVSEDATQIDLRVSYGYFNYPKSNTFIDSHEMGFSAGMPNLLPFGFGINYFLGNGWIPDDGQANFQYHSICLCNSIVQSETYSLDLFGDINYNNDMFYQGSDWTHTTVGVSLAGLAINSLSFTPFITYQSSLVDGENEIDGMPITDTLFGGLKACYSF